MNRSSKLLLLANVAALALWVAITSPANHRSAEPPALPVPVSTSAAGVIVKVYDPTLERYAPMWRAEIARRFPNAVGVLLHGGELMEGRWTVKTSETYRQEAKEVVLKNMRLYPGKVVILLACNPAHLSLGVPGVYYATDSVWCVPDHAVRPDQFRSDDRLTIDGPPASATLGLIPYSEWDSIFPSLLPDGKAPRVVYRERPLTRWEEDPTVQGNIFEFVTD